MFSFLVAVGLRFLIWYNLLFRVEVEEIVAVGLRFLIWYNLPWNKPLITGAFFIKRKEILRAIILKKRQLCGIFARFTACRFSITDDSFILFVGNL